MPLPGSAAQPAGRTFLRDRAYGALFDAIQSGQLLPGEVLRDEELMAWLGMSRTPIRHALIRLAESGLIEMSAGRQTTVAELAPDRTNRALFVSAVFNEYAARRVVGTDVRAIAEALTARRDEVRAAVESGDGLRIARGVSAFFRVLTERVGNAELDGQVGRIDTELARFLSPGGAVTTVDVQALRSTVDVVHDAVLAGELSAVLDAFQALYVPTRESFLSRFREPEID
ncbi:DNA-binding transcriptional regulator, GntR family [Curtobacterium sp. 314Chir4.1]|uniref:GntR family transcriptional regulator n=1 Tax=Curtobacterium sp. 314Chir4.1 TaxID=1279028 RepID=UPI000BDB906F|nr:GntR family transcriptional regulator [Curtobacterium sp. 314Chir4.1]SOC89562.1 DNA-binding transcriptional regulator, GntR family [Curtobacterium sp. 314Chir4.1]